MSSDSDSSDEVDFNVYRKEYESEEHWKLRKWFMIHHWDKVEDEQEILCCAQLFVNIEFLGCRYAPEIMQKIRLMSDEVPQIKKYRESRKDKLKRTFVTAKDAVQAKYTKTTPIMTRETYQPQQTTYHSFRPAMTPFKIDINWTASNADKDDWDIKQKMDWKRYVQDFEMELGPQQPKNLRSLLRNVIVFESSEENDFNYCFNKTTACMRKIGKLVLNCDNEKNKYEYLFNDQIIAEGTGNSKKEAKKAADENLIKTLKANCYTIRSKLKFYSGEDVITRNGTKEVKQDQQQIQEDNLGFKLLAKLGWKGGSLGANATGIIDPINLEIKIGKSGLGCDIKEFDKKYFRNLLQNFRQNQVEYDLIFSPEFSKEERAEIHKIASQLNLRTKSYGKNSSRHLVISTRLSPQVLREKMIEGDDYLREKYDLIAPPPLEKVQRPHLV